MPFHPDTFFPTEAVGFVEGLGRSGRMTGPTNAVTFQKTSFVK